MFSCFWKYRSVCRTSLPWKLKLLLRQLYDSVEETNKSSTESVRWRHRGNNKISLESTRWRHIWNNKTSLESMRWRHIGKIKFLLSQWEYWTASGLAESVKSINITVKNKGWTLQNVCLLYINFFTLCSNLH